MKREETHQQIRDTKTEFRVNQPDNVQAVRKSGNVRNSFFRWRRSTFSVSPKLQFSSLFPPRTVSKNVAVRNVTLGNMDKIKFDPAEHLTKQGWKGKGTGTSSCPSPTVRGRTPNLHHYPAEPPL